MRYLYFSGVICFYKRRMVTLCHPKGDLMGIRRGTIVVTSVYKRAGGRNYYFKFTDLDGKRHQLSTGKANKRDALLYAQAYVDRLAEGNRHEIGRAHV